MKGDDFVVEGDMCLEKEDWEIQAENWFWD